MISTCVGWRRINLPFPTRDYCPSVSTCAHAKKWPLAETVLDPEWHIDDEGVFLCRNYVEYGGGKG